MLKFYCNTLEKSHLLILVEKERKDEIVELLAELDKQITDKRELLEVLQDSLDSVHKEAFYTVYNYLKDLDIHFIMPGEIYHSILDYFYKELIGNIKNKSIYVQKNLNDIEEWRENKGLSRSLIADYIQLILDKDNLSESEFRQKMENINNQNASSSKEVEIKYDMIMIYGDPEIIVQKKPDAELLSDNLLRSYLIIAYIKTDNVKQALELIVRGQPMDKLSDRIRRYISEDEYTRFLEKIGLKREVLQKFNEAMDEKYRLFLQEELFI